jgi:spore coat protein H
MSKPFRASMTALVFAVVGLARALAEPPAKEAPGKDVFGLAKVWQLHLEVAAREGDKMQPTGGRRFPGGPGGFPGAPGGPPRPAEKTEEKAADVHKGSGFGMDFPRAHAALTAEGKTYKDLGLRYKGNASYMASARGLKRNLKIEFDHYDGNERFHGLKTLNLNAGAMDPTKGHEALAYAVFRAAGVPAPRTAFAEVTLTVPGKYDKELLGLYTVVEQVDKRFLKDRFGTAKGLLMKPERVRGVDYLGEDWDRYKDRYRPKHEPSKKEARRVIDFARLVHKAGDEQFRKEIASYLDVDEFLRFAAVNALVVNLDSVFGMGHNFYLYLHPETNKFVFIPWDLDLSMAGFPMLGSTDQQLDLSLTHPYAGENKLLDRLLAIKEVNERYHKLLGDLAATCFTKEKLLADVAAIEGVTKEALARETKAREARKEGAIGFGPPGGGPGGFLAGALFRRADGDKDGKVTLDELLAAAEALFKEADKDRKGSLDAKGVAAALNALSPPAFGPGGGPGGRPGGFGVGNFWAKPLLEALDADKDGKVSKEELAASVKKFFKVCDKDNKGKVDEQALAGGVSRILPAPPGFGPPGGGFGGGSPSLRTFVEKRTEAVAAQLSGKSKGYVPAPAFGRGFGVGNFWVKPLLEALDADKDGKVSKEELAAGVKKFFKVCDRDNKGMVDEQAIADALARLMPPPPGFGPPGGGPGGPPGPGGPGDPGGPRGPGGPGGRGVGFGPPGRFLAGAVVRRADADKDGKVTLAELLAAAEALFQEADKDKNGSLDEKAIGAAIGLLFPPPPGFGPPPGGR